MTKTIIMIVVLVCGFVAINAQDTAKNRLHGVVEVESEVTSFGVTPQVKTLLNYGGKSKVGAYCWIQNSKSYNQFYCGPTYSIKFWIQVGGAVGMQTGGKTLQLGAFVWAGHNVGGKFVHNLFIIEKGGTWYRNETMVAVTKRYSAGIATQKFKGTGPRFEAKLNKNFTAGAELRFGERTNLTFGLKYSF